MSDSQRLEVSTRVPARGQLHQLFRVQDARCGNVEGDPRQLMSIAADGPGRYVRADGTLVGAGLRDGAELLLAVAHCDGLDWGTSRRRRRRLDDDLNWSPLGGKGGLQPQRSCRSLGPVRAD